ncbi:unnamed protein product [Soboliphyme baturini]|uniref:ADH_zinc_N domain-containing protein n=1 Tax=Soboliphyme baturini TaxID=241478 RepID=A0A183J2X1_9BILA|nr:unnamed protein product [Soboliphyme baturini]
MEGGFPSTSYLSFLTVVWVELSRAFVPVRSKYKKRFYRGIYITDGMAAHKDDVLVRQFKLDYFPGVNVSCSYENCDKVLRAMCDGTVMITTENVVPDFSLPEMVKAYEWRKDVPLYKLTFNVVPFEPSRKFKLVEQI